ncbi:ThuA-like domain-containing protein [Massariosphaeria phaeospora]|uniref:ThuA-like domain-containing protein n=1 Tax=Massariosphaeria phaeospora TaxID=100035 RepID=A0A7C8M100_9PLEO|nr:ThuA-like domain-containing protein [Massariosphaeria phaeospora]
MSLPAPFNVLIFSATSGYRHTSIPAGIAGLRALADTTQRLTADHSEDAAAVFTPSALAQYAVVVLLQCSGDFVSAGQLDALRNFVRAGGGVVGIHGAAAGMLDDEWYGKLIGAHFKSHPDPEPGTVLVEDGQAGHRILGGHGRRSGWTDEWYNFHSHPRENANLTVLLKGDTQSFAGGLMGDDHPLAWCQEFEGGRSFYTALGHFDEAFRDEWYMGQILRAVLWAAGREGGGDEGVGDTAWDGV